MALTNFNIEPYNDDFDAAKRFYKILFRPSYAVQARELTQLQSILQNQIKNFGEHVFKDGSMVIPGSISINLDYEYVRLQASENLVLSELVGSTLYGARTGIKSVVVNYAESTDTDPPTIFVEYLNTSTVDTVFGTDLVPEETYKLKASRYIKNEILNNADGDPVCQVEIDNLNAYLPVSGKGSSITIQEGVYFIDGYFVNNDFQELILDKYFNNPSYKIGFSTKSRFVNSFSDTTLNDNATGVSNTNAPGADRYTIDLTLIKKSLDDTDDTDFVKLIELKNGSQERVVNKAEYNILEETLARRTYDESGNYVVKQFDIDIREHRNTGTNRGIYIPNPVFKYENVYTKEQSNGLLALGMSPGKAYVYGYEVENPNTKYVTISKAREYDTVQNSSTSILIGNYFRITNLSNIPDIGSATSTNISSIPYGQVELKNSSNMTIGTAYVRYLDYESGDVTTTSAIFRLGIFDLSFNAHPSPPNQYSISDIDNISQSASPAPFTCDLVDSVLYDSKNSCPVFKLPQSVVKTFKTDANNSVVDINYEIKRTFVGTASGSQISFSVGTGETFAAVSNQKYTISQYDSGTGTITIINLNNVSLSNNNQTLDIDNLITNSQIKVIATISKSISSNNLIKTKTLQEDQTLDISGSGNATALTISLDKSDIYQLKAVYMAADFDTAATDQDLDITDRFVLDNGQREGFYDKGSIIRKNSEAVPTGNLHIVFDYFQHSSGDFFCVDSYSSVDYDIIPEFNSATKGKLYLRDCIDFRPRIDAATDTFTGTNASLVDFPANYSSFITDFDYYLPRIDSVGINSSGKFVISKGVAALDPQKPPMLDNTMILYYLYLPAYTYKTSDVKVTPVDNRRYTMRDIGKLEKRIKNVEYYTQLSLLEQNALNTQILDNSGLDRFKNGIIVDNFKGHNIGDVTSANYFCSIDMAEGELRPEFTQNIVELSEKNTTDTLRTNSGYRKTGELITLPYTNSVLTQNTFATKAVNCNPFLVFQYVGEVFLTPDVDEWFDTQTLPDLVVNNNHLYDSISSLTETDNNLGTIWNNWQTEWSGTTSSTETFSGDLDVDTTITIKEERQTRTGISRELAGDNFSTANFGERVVNTSYIPFIRSRTITFTGKRLKPNTRVYPFFDEVNVGSFCAPSGGSNGGALITDDNGEITGTFTIPNDNFNRFRTGERVFRLTSSLINAKGTSVTDDEVTTFAEGRYTARGMQQTKQNTIQSTRVPIIRTQSVSDTNIIRTIDNVSVNASAKDILNNVTNLQESTAESISNLSEEIDNNSSLINSNAESIAANSVNIDTLDQQVQEQIAALARFQEEVAALDEARRQEIDAELQAMRAENTAMFGELGESIEQIWASVREIQDSTARTQQNMSQAVQRFMQWWGNNDPLAQTFLNDSSGGCFVTSVDLYFKSKDSNIPIKVYLTSTNASRPTDIIIPFSEVILLPSEVNISDDATVATTVTFPSPVYLEPNKEYAIVLKPKSQKYEAWVSRLGQNEIGTTRRVTTQPLLGSLFRSQNARLWTEDQYEDLKFTLYKAQFTTNRTGTVDFVNSEITTDNLITNCFVTTKDQGTVTVLHKNHGMNSFTGSNSKVEITFPSGATGYINGIPLADLSGEFDIVVGSSSLDHYQIVAKNSSTATSTGSSGVAGITAKKEINFQVLQPQIGQLIFDGTKTEHFIKTTTIPGPYETADAYAFDTTFKKISPADNYYFKENRSVLSGLNETAYLSGNKSVLYRVGLFSANKNLSPVLDINRMNLFAISNRLSNHDLNIDYNYVAETDPIVGSAVAKYITKEITLNNPSTALDLRLTASVYPTSSIDVYYKTKLQDDSRSLIEIPFALMTLQNTPTSSEQRSQTPYSREFKTDFSEYQYLEEGLPEFVSFQIKIVMKGTNPAFPPRISDMRGIALAL